mmetsp:Transcript_47752/g.79220  ORF Transcript_47752/g.79220 Transcript_47752/m.79220 type:complete len:205 (-) Transcript_47752:260-874(-)|eukprot:CAMPEP_0202689892 /NCGR_PEP_ID=MMETSP1385-20130828/5067_1 /ASSEMBLY_ACC=CAM_ASM_000861 /TAXON_ID=933848 /ORGANISM="Elphidium margaritaceum" /LENGTH=204 /DNA_ID=CAMNT_0049345103 /DNA_START=99 /DNA_END=713 /DNA_ORIENTATION=-
MSIMEYNGGAVVAMKGKDCVAIACDRRFGTQQTTVAMDNTRIFKIHNKLYIGLGGLMTDVQTVGQILQFRHNLYRLREKRNMSPAAFTKVVSNLLYSKRFGPYFVDPIIVGLDKNDEPFVSSMDLIGATEISDNFACVGTTEDELYGICENLWNDKMEDKDLFETISQSLLSATDRDCLAGWGSVVYLIKKNSVEISELKARQD